MLAGPAILDWRLCLCTASTLQQTPHALALTAVLEVTPMKYYRYNPTNTVHTCVNGRDGWQQPIGRQKLGT